jgi:hypothetical protein
MEAKLVCLKQNDGAISKRRKHVNFVGTECEKIRLHLNQVIEFADERKESHRASKPYDAISRRRGHMKRRHDPKPPVGKVQI